MSDPHSVQTWLDFVEQNKGIIGGGFGTLATAGAFIIKQWWEDRREQREFEAEKSREDRLMDMVEQSLKDRRVEGERNTDVLTRILLQLESQAKDQRAANGKLDKILGRLPTNGAVQHDA